MAIEVQNENEEAEAPQDNAAKAEWVALMCLIAKNDRDLYRKLRAEAWESVALFGICSKGSN